MLEADNPGAYASFPLSYAQVERANSHARKLFDGPILTRQKDEYLSCRSFFLSKQRGRRRSAMRIPSNIDGECTGSVFGCALGHIVRFCTHAGVNPTVLVKKVHDTLVPIAAAVLSQNGTDSNPLCSGLAAHRIARIQQLKMGQNELPKNVDRRQANPTIVIGLTASILIVYTLLASDVVSNPRVSRASDVAWFVQSDSLKLTLEFAEEILCTSVPPPGMGGAGGVCQFERYAVDAELRAIQRARRGVETATALAAQHRMPHTSTFAMQLAFYTRAAFPPNEMLGRDMQEALLERMRHPLFFTAEASVERVLLAHAIHPGVVVPLAELGGIGARCGLVVGRGGGSSETDSSSIATGSSKRARSDSDGASSVGGGGSDFGDDDDTLRPLVAMRLADVSAP